jgi:hypothetical protein
MEAVVVAMMNQMIGELNLLSVLSTLIHTRPHCGGRVGGDRLSLLDAGDDVDGFNVSPPVSRRDGKCCALSLRSARRRLRVRDAHIPERRVGDVACSRVRDVRRLNQRL